MAQNDLNLSRSLCDWLKLAGVEDSSKRQSIEAFFQSKTKLSLKALAGAVMTKNSVVREFIRSVILRFMSTVPTESFSELGVNLRSTDQCYVAHRWWNVSAWEAKIYLAMTRDRYTAMLLTFHPSGRVRESAVRFLGRISSGEELRFLLFRQNDWVPKVSELAQSLVKKRLRVNYLEHFVGQSELLAAMLRWKRNDLSSNFNRLIDLLVHEKNRLYLQATIQNCRGKGGRRLFSSLLATGDADVIRFGAASVDPIVCCKSLQHAKHGLPQEECFEIANGKLSSKNPIVRVAAHELKASSQTGARPTDVWMSCLFDRSHIVRRTAAFHLAKLGCNLADHCRVRLKTNPGDFAAIALLADEGEAADVAVFQAVLNTDPPPRFRAEAIRGIGKHGRANQVTGLCKYLCNPNTRTIRMARSQLMPVARELDAQAMWELVPKCQNPLGKRAIVQLVAKCGFWKSLPWLLQAIVSDDSVFASAALDMVDFFSGCGRFVQPTQIQRTAIQESLNRYRSQFSKEVAESLGFYLGGFGFVVGKEEG